MPVRAAQASHPTGGGIFKNQGQGAWLYLIDPHPAQREVTLDFKEALWLGEGWGYNQWQHSGGNFSWTLDTSIYYKENLLSFFETYSPVLILGCDNQRLAFQGRGELHF